MNILKKLFCKHEFEFNSNVYGDMINFVTGGNRSIWRCSKCGKYEYRPNLYTEKDVNKLISHNSIDEDKVSDGYHTFEELYDHRMELFSVICNQNKYIAWKSKLHDDGTMYDNYFIVGITTSEGDYSYHYHLNNWDNFNVKELDKAPVWDGHKPSDIGRLRSILKSD